MANRSLTPRLVALVEDYLSSGFARNNLPTDRPTDLSTDRPTESRDSSESDGSHVSHARPAQQLNDQERIDELDALMTKIRSCMACPLSAVRNRAVPGVGVLDPLVMVIGEGPGADEDRTGEPFVGRAGNFLDKWLEALDLSRRRNAYITNIVKCRPPQNRDPLPDERSSCSPYLERQIELVRPRAILTVGRISSRVICGVDGSMGQIRRSTHMFRGIPVVATYHPSAVLRNETLKRPVWEDLKRLREMYSGR